MRWKTIFFISFFDLVPMLYKLPSNLRASLAQPVGTLFPGLPSETHESILKWIHQIQQNTSKENKSHISEGSYLQDEELPLVDKKRIGDQKKIPIVAVGDVISQSLLDMPSIRPDIKFLFIDGGTQRGIKVDLTNISKFKRREFTNPPGYINDEIITFIQNSRGDENQYLIWIDGEEDLLVIPLILTLSRGILLYGQPPITDIHPPIPAGAVGLEITKTIQEKITTLWDQFIPQKKEK